MNQFWETVQEFFIDRYEDILLFFELILDGSGVVYGLLRAAFFVVIFALILGYVLNNRRATPPRTIVIGILIVVIVLVLFTVFG
jgi:hypothetical protein